MNSLTNKSIGCPYCGETIAVLIEPADVNQQYIEDCQVCCKSITFMVFEHNNGEYDVNIYPFHLKMHVSAGIRNAFKQGID